MLSPLSFSKCCALRQFECRRHEQGWVIPLSVRLPVFRLCPDRRQLKDLTFLILFFWVSKDRTYADDRYDERVVVEQTALPLPCIRDALAELGEKGIEIGA